MHPDLQAFIDIVWNNLGRLRESDDIYDIYGRHGFVDNQRNDQNLKKYKDVVSRERENIKGFIIDMRDVSQALDAAQGDDRIESRMQTGGRVWDGQPTTEVPQDFESGHRVTEELAGAFYHFERDLPVGRTGPQQVRHRLYIALDDGNYRRAANTIVGALLQALKEIDAIAGFHKFKAMGPYSVIVEGRRDHIVAYFSDQKSRKTVTERIIAMAQKNRKLTAGPLPFCIEKQAEGIGWADEPPGPGNTSYGSYLADAIWEVAQDFDPRDKSPQARATFHQAALWQFAKYRIDPERPWANIGYYRPPRKKERAAPAIRPATLAATRAATNAAGVGTTADRVRLRHRRRGQALAPADERPAPQDPGGEGRGRRPPARRRRPQRAAGGPARQHPPPPA